MRAYPNAGTNPCAGANPRAFLDMNWFRNEIKRRRFVVVIAGAEKRPLRNADVAFNHDGCEVQQPAFLAQPDMVAQRELPRKGDFHLRLDDHATPNFCAKQPQPENAKGAKTKL